MEKYWLRRENNDAVVVVVLGWACDWRGVEHLSFRGCDVLCTYDYRTLNYDDAVEMRALVGSYPHRYLLAWSFGVWVAEQLFGAEGVTSTDKSKTVGTETCHALAFERAVALNGTPRPVDARFGIEPRRLAVTLRGLQAGGMEAFDRRTYGRWFDALREVLSPRGVAANVEELTCLSESALVPYEPSLRWDRGVVGRDDVIFPLRNMVAYWGDRAEIVSLPHYPFGDAELILREIEH